MRSWLKAAAGVLGFVGASYVVVSYLLPFVAPFILAALLSELIRPVVTFLEKRARMPRWLAVLGVLLFSAGLLVSLVAWGIYRLTVESQVLIANTPHYTASVTTWMDTFSAKVGMYQDALPGFLKTAPPEIATQVGSVVKTVGGNLLGAFSAVSSVSMLLLNGLIMLVATFFFSRDREGIYPFLLQLLPGNIRSKVRTVKDEVWTSVLRFAKAQFILISMTCIQVIGGLLLIGEEYAVTMGLLAAVADALPVVGLPVVMFPLALFHFITGSTAMGIEVLVLYVFVMSIRTVLESKVVGVQIGMHPLATLFAGYVGLQLFGAFGFVLGPLLAILLVSMIRAELLPTYGQEHS